MQWIVDIIRFKLAAYLQGKIFLWSGTIASIPAGWALCNGTQGTPNLRPRFVPGAGSVFAPGARGGAPIHAHDFAASGIFHTIKAGALIADGAHLSRKTNTHYLPGTTNSADGQPPFYTLAFIMKL